MNPEPSDTGPTEAISGPLRDYEAAVDWLDSHIDLERLLGSAEATPPTLDRMWTLMGVLGDPQDSVPTIHITGTNGKGSTARLAVALLGSCGLAAGSYTSPHIERVNDRITVADEPLDDESFTLAISEIAVFESMVTERCGERPNYFEVMAAAAYNWFASNAHVNVIEVGMGGRWDATNVVDAAVAVITNIGADHLEIIGPTRCRLGCCPASNCHRRPARGHSHALRGARRPLRAAAWCSPSDERRHGHQLRRGVLWSAHRR